MHGFAFKTVIASAILFSVFSHSLFAAEKNSVQHDAKLFAPAGCMSCHQGEALTLPADKLSDKSHGKQHAMNHKRIVSSK